MKSEQEAQEEEKRGQVKSEQEAQEEEKRGQVKSEQEVREEEEQRRTQETRREKRVQEDLCAIHVHLRRCQISCASSSLHPKAEFVFNMARTVPPARSASTQNPNHQAQKKHEFHQLLESCQLKTLECPDLRKIHSQTYTRSRHMPWWTFLVSSLSRNV